MNVHEWPTHICFVQCESLVQQPVHLLPFRFTSIGPDKQPLKNVALKTYVQITTKVTTDGYIWGSMLNWYVHLPFRDNWHFWLRDEKFHIWPLKLKVRIMAKVKPDGHIWGVEFNRYVCFWFRTFFGYEIANSICERIQLKSIWWPRSSPRDTLEA